MIQHPEIQVKLRDYIKSVCLDVDGEIQMAKIGAVQTPYLEAMVHETLRLSRASPGSARLGEQIRNWTRTQISDHFDKSRNTGQRFWANQSRRA